MSFFNIGIKILSIGVLIFFIIFFYFCLLWTERFEEKPGQKKKIKVAVISAFMVSLLYSFKIFLIGVAILAITSLILKYI